MRTASWLRALGVLALGGAPVGLAPACSGDTFGVGDTFGRGCAVSSDCSSPLVCAFGRCHSVCNESRDCPAGSRCVKSDTAGTCILEDDEACSYTSDCPAGLTCAVDQQCRAQCQADRDCLPAQKCVRQTCADPAELDDAGNLPTDAGEEAGPDAAGDADASSEDAAPAPDADATSEDASSASCAAGTTWCSGATLVTCTGVGNATTTTPCAGGTPVCDAARKACTRCRAGGASCAGSALSICAADGQSFTSQADCGSVAMCDAVGARCMPPGSVTQFSLGASHGCAVLAGGDVRCWGENNFGQLGAATPALSTTAVTVPGVVAPDQISSGWAFSCAVVGGGVRCWGANDYGQLGVGQATQSGQPASAITGLTKAAEVRAAQQLACVRLTSGGVKCWGSNARGGLGMPGSTDKYLPTDVANVAGVTELEASPGASTMCARLATPDVKCWGDGIGAPTLIPGIVDVVEVAVASVVGVPTIFLRSGAGEVTYVRQNGAGYTVPMPYATGVKSLTACEDVVLALGTDGVLRSANANDASAPPDALAPNAMFPTGSVVEARCGGTPGGTKWKCVRTVDDVLACFGDDYVGEVGTGTRADFTPWAVRDPDLLGAVRLVTGGAALAAVFPDGSIAASGNSDALGLSASGFSSMGFLGVGVRWLELMPTHDYPWDPFGYAVGESGALALVEHGALAPAGRLAGTSLGSFAQAFPNDSGDVGRLADGRVVVLAVATDANSSGIFGDGTTTATVGQQAIVPGTAGSSGLAARDVTDHACAWFADGSLSCWGDSTYGQVGNGVSGANVTAPEKVAIPGGAKVRSAVVGLAHTCALVEGGDVYCWGAVGVGLGVPGGNPPSTPQKVPNVAGAIELAAGEYHTCARLGDGSVRCWGGNLDGQLGNGTFQDGTPQPVVGLGPVAQIAAGMRSTCALHLDGGVSCWGRVAGQLARPDSGVPRPVQGLDP